MSRFKQARPAIDSADAKAGATNLLYGCTLPALADKTAAGVAHSYHLTEKTAAYLLWKARRDRGVGDA